MTLQDDIQSRASSCIFQSEAMCLFLDYPGRKKEILICKSCFLYLGVHDQSHNGNEEGKALSVDNVEENHSVGILALVLVEGVEHRAGNVDAHSRHPEEDSDQSVVNEVTQSHTASSPLIIVPVVLKEIQSIKDLMTKAIPLCPNCSGFP